MLDVSKLLKDTFTGLVSSLQNVHPYIATFKVATVLNK